MDDEPWPIPDYAWDKHTGAGRRLGRSGADFWFREGCKLNKPTDDVADPYREKAEALWRAGKENAPKWPKRKKKGNDKAEQGQLF